MAGSGRSKTATSNFALIGVLAIILLNAFYL